MSAAANVDVVLVIDTSSSMQPCIDQLKLHLRELLKPMQGHVGKVRFGLVGLSASATPEGGVLYKTETLAGSWDTVALLYSGGNQYEFLTENADKVIARLDSLEVSGDEDNLLALDIALDHPFGPVGSTKRVVALFTDEKLEAGVQREHTTSFVPKIIEKLHARRIKLFCAMPFSDAAEQLSQANGSEIEDVGDGRGLASVDFKTLLGQMGKSISVSSLQGAMVESYQRAIFDQDKWVTGSSTWNERDPG